MKRYILHIIIFQLIILLWFSTYSQNSSVSYGTPMIFNYTSKDYLASPENYAIVQDKQGIIYVGNNGYILEYDGVVWRKIEVKRDLPVLSLGIDSLGTVYVSTGNEFGFLQPNSSGELKYTSLSKDLNFHEVQKEGIGKVLITKNAVCFQTSQSLIIYPLFLTFTGKNRIINIPKPIIIKAKTQYNNSFAADNNIFIDQKDLGLSQLINRQLVPVKNKNFLRWKTIAILPYATDRVVVCTEKGIYFYKFNQGFMKFDSETDMYLDEISILSATILPDVFVFSTLNKGTMVIARKLTGKKRKIIEQYNKLAGLPTEQINNIYNNKDYDNNLLWMTSAYGISKTQINSTIRKINEASDVKDVIIDVIRNEKILYVRTLGEVYYMKDTLDTHQFLKVKKVTSTSDWLSFPVEVLIENKDKKKKGYKFFNKKIKPPTKIEQQIVLGSKNGLQLIDGDEAFQIKPNFKVFYYPKNKKHAYTLINNSKGFPTVINKLYRSKKNNFRIFVASNNGLDVISYQNGKWIDEGYIDQINDNITGITEDTIGNLWLSNNYGEAISIFVPDTNIIYKTPSEYGNKKDSLTYQFFPKNPFVQKYNESIGLPTLIENGVFCIDGKSILSTKKGLYSYQMKGIKNIEFKPETKFGKDFSNGTYKVLSIVQDSKGNCWMRVKSDFYSGIVFFIKEKNKEYRRHDESIKLFPEMTVETIYPDRDGIVWVSGSQGLYVFNNNVQTKSKKSFNALIRKVIIGKDSVIFGGSNYTFNEYTQTWVISHTQNKTDNPRIKYKHNSLTFIFAAPFYDNESSTMFQYYMEGLDTTWSDWTANHVKEYSSLPNGKYIFRVKARNIFDNESTIAEYKFRILPPWYRTWWAYILYIIALTGLVTLIIKVNSRRLVREKRHLEQIVEERTQEVVRQKHEIELKNENITNSINYAKRIQQAMLPPPGSFGNLNVKDHFILFKPRDIVSGDFYFFTKKVEETLSLQGKQRESVEVIAAVDCTGHGIPGAFMSMIGYSLLSDIVERTSPDAALILSKLHTAIRLSLQQEKSDNVDGMDIALVIIKDNGKTLEYAGAMNSLTYIQNGVMNVIKGNRFGIGGKQNAEYKVFTNHKIPIDVPTTIYLNSDGFQDQFGGDEGYKLMAVNFRKILLEIHEKPMAEQKIILKQKLADWMGKDYQQLDDILVIGFKI
jgi:serine phosphatase RsbU (regulator of sigma subunit)